jgi:hypothetical protein
VAAVGGGETFKMQITTRVPIITTQRQSILMPRLPSSVSSPLLPPPIYHDHCIITSTALSLQHDSITTKTSPPPQSLPFL